jgi:hypothetical protein
MTADLSIDKSAGAANLRSAPVSRRGGPSLFHRILEVLHICSRATAAAHQYEQLKPLSNEALAARGLKRDDLPRAAFDKLTEEP